jgi:hypothetical protein
VATVEEALLAVLLGAGGASHKLGLPYWKGFESATLLPPPKCRELWRQFDAEVEVYILQAVSHQVPKPPWPELSLGFCLVELTAK